MAVKKENLAQNNVLGGGTAKTGLSPTVLYTSNVTPTKLPNTTTTPKTLTPTTSSTATSKLSAGVNKLNNVAGSVSNATASPTVATPSTGGGYSEPAPAPSAPSQTVVDPSKTVDRSLQDASWEDYQNAMGYLNEQSQMMPQYENQYANAIDTLYGQIVNRNAFTYNLNEDQLYQQYRDNYMNQANLAMRNAMGQASGLTGGYGSSYAQAVGQQNYDATMQHLNDIVPDLYNAAYQHYQDEGNRMMDAYKMTLDREASDYDRYGDQLRQWNTDRDFAQSQADKAYSKWANERDYADKQEVQLQAERNANLQKLLALSPYGYSPTSQELADAGVTPEQWQYYAASVAPQPTGGGGGGSSSAGYNEFYTQALSNYATKVQTSNDKVKSAEEVNHDILYNPYLSVEDKRSMIEAISKQSQKK